MPIGRIYLPSSILIATTDLLCHACHNLIFPVCRDNTRMVSRPGQTFNTYYIQYIKNELNQLNNFISVIQITLVQTLIVFWDSGNLFIIINDFKTFLLTNLLELSFKNKNYIYCIYPVYTNQLPRFVKTMYLCQQKCCIIYIKYKHTTQQKYPMPNDPINIILHS